MTRLLAVVVLLGALASTSVAAAQDVPERRVGVQWREGVPRVHVSVTDLADAWVRRKLTSGLPTQLVFRVYAYRASGSPIALSGRACRVTYDLWDETYRVRIEDGRRERDESFEDVSGVLRRCLVADRIAIGRRADYAGLRGENIYFAVVVEVNPIDPSTVRRLRRWLARPAGGGRIGGSAFFGSFVSLFVNRQIGAAERTRRFRSQLVRVRR